MYREHNKTTLDRALRQLPEHQPPAALWEAIEEELEMVGSPTQLEDAIRDLPRYTPPSELWQQIAAGLDSDTSAGAPRRQAAGHRHIIFWRIAAAIALLVTAGAIWWGTMQQPAPVVTIEQTQEVLSEELAANADWNADEAVFHQILDQVRTHPLLREAPATKTLQEELQELDLAKEEIEYMMQRYGQDPDLIRQIGEIERERSDILKQLIAMI